ncbi:MAG: Ig-like domain-containing protein [Cytophagaceae bacterium]|nr:Ig-like domain-containing protein [Gemmatimonadaceae bacterium]
MIDASRMQRGAWRVLASLLISTVSCDNPLSPGEGVVDRIDLNPSSVALTVGETRTVGARVIGANGASITDRTVFWTTQNPVIATVSQSGVISGVGAGVTQVAASAGGKSAVVQVAVAGRPVSQVRIAPPTATVQAGGTVTLRAEPVDATGGEVTGRTALWATSAAPIATVTSTGVVTGLTPGSATITATVDGINGSSVVTVTAVPVASVTVSPSTGSLIVGQTLTLSATTASATGQTLVGRVVTWTSSANTIATVSSTGEVSAVGAGVATITATSEGRTGTSEITVSAVPVASIRITPGAASVPSGQTTQLSAQALDANNNVLNRTITWTSDQPSVATVSQAGVVTGVIAGAARISASVGAVSGTVTVTVTPVPVASLTITPNGATIVVGGTLQLTATAKDANGVTLPGRIIGWTSGGPSIATVSQSGLVTAIGPGSATILAASEGVFGSVNITVTNVGVAIVRVIPSNSSLQVGAQLQLTTQVLDANNNTITGKTASWVSSNQAIATVSSVGTVFGIAPGTVTITATVDGVSGIGTYAVGLVPVGAISLSPGSATILPGATVTLVPTLTGTNGQPLLPSTRTIIWSSNATNRATVSTTGVVTGVSQGAAIITATTEGVSATSTINVSSTPIATISILPNPGSVVEANSTPLALTATARAAGGAVIPGVTFFWASNNPLVSVNSSTGAVTALVGAGGVTATITASAPGGGPGGTTPSGTTTVNVSYAPVATAAVSPGTATLSVGSNLTLTLAIRTASGQVLTTTGRTITWTSLDPTFATVGSTTGVVTGVGSGAARIEVRASSPGQATPVGDTATITVQNVAPVASIVFAISPDSTILPGTPLTGTATLRDAANNLLQGRVVSFTTSDPSIATVSPVSATSNAAGQITGITITGVGAGAATITATRDVSATFVARILNPVNTVSVTSIPDSVIGASAPIQAVATLRDAGNVVITGRPITWNASNNSAVATVSPSGLITVVGGLGSALLSATSEGKTGSFNFRVLAPIASVSISTPGDSVIGTTTLAATATVRDANNNLLTGRPIAWTTSHPSIATVNSSGLITGVSEGNATITATAEGRTASVLARVLPGIATLDLTPATDSLIGMGTLAITTTATSAGAVPIPGRTVTITSSNPAVATASPGSAVTNGSGAVPITITSVAPGSTTLTVTAEGRVTTRVLRMLAPVATVAVTTPGDSILGTGTLQASVVLRDANNNVLSGRPVTWGPPGSPAVISVGTSGLITALATGTSTLTATSEGQQSQAITVRVLAAVNTVTVTAPDSSIYVTQSVQATAVLRDGLNAILTGRPITWGSTNTGVATISATGAITAVAPGTTTISATAEGKSATMAFTVSLVPAHTIAITPNALLFNETPTFVGTPRDTANNNLTGRTITWSTSNPKLSINAASGTVAAADTGTVYVIAETTPGTGPGNIAKDSVLVTVGLVPLNTVTLSPTGPINIGLGTTAPVTATVRDVNNALAFLPHGRACAMASNNTSVVTVSAATGLTTAAGEIVFSVTASGTNTGTANVTVTCEGKVATLVVTVP